MPALSLRATTPDAARSSPTKERDPRVAAAATGDRAAQAALVRSLQDVWFRFCLSRLRDHHAARDAAQETALRFLRKLDGFAHQSTLQTWSLGIALNVCREARRRLGRDSTNQDDALRLAGPTARSHAPAADARLDITEAINKLPDRQAEAVTLRYLQGLSTREAAAAMGCAEGTVKATLSHALTALRTHLSEKESTDHETPDA